MPEHPNPKIRSVPVPSRPTTRSEHPYAELSVTTNFSFLEGASHPDELVYRAAELGYRAIAVTDRNSLAGAVRMHEAAKQVSIKLLVGARLCFTDAPDVLAWVPNRGSYASLCRLLTLGRRRAEKGECQLHLSDLLESSSGLLLALVPPADLNGEWHESLRQLREAAGERLSLAATCLYDGKDKSRLQTLHELGRALCVPLLATNDVHYHDPSRRALQDVLTCIRHRCTIRDAGYRLFANAERYLKPPAHMHRLFTEHPRAIHRGLEIAERCSFDLEELRYEYPDELVPEGTTPIQHLVELSWAGARERYPQGISPKVRQQIEHELRLIEQLRYEAYFLTVHDLVRFARSRDILCQGRGSAANSAVCYCLGITAVDPARVDVLFERFISAARGEPPDIDVDFEHERREEVLQYIYQKYGRERAGMTATVITYRGRSAVRDVGKALGLSLDLVDQMAKKLDGWHRGTISASEVRELGLDPKDRTVRQVVGLTSQLLGFPRHLSQHVGGMMMTRGPLCELVPIENASMEGRTVIEWDKDDIDAIGILKVDVLALGMLTCLAKCLKLINESRPTEPPLELYSIPAEDPQTYDMICDADTVGVFQIESRAQMSMLPRLKPRSFYDLVIEVAIVRPGPIQGDMVHPYLRRRDGLEPVEYPSEALRRVLEKTLGVPLFQEQAMKIAIVGAGFTPEDADRLRKGMAGWRRQGVIERFHKKFVQGMEGNGYSEEFAERCFDQIRGFSEYGFPESHAASFALLAYASSWLKRHHPAAFAAALLNSQPMGFYAPAQIVRDARDHAVEVRAVDVNHSEWDCTLERPSSTREQQKWPKPPWGLTGPALRLGLRMVRGLHSAHAQQMNEARGRVGLVQSIEHLHKAARLPVAATRRLAEADAFGSLGVSRREAVWQTLSLKDDDAPLFENVGTPEPVVRLPTMPVKQEVTTDYATVGLSLKTHPIALVRNRLSERKVVTAEVLQSLPRGRWVSVAGLVLIRQRPGTASGVVFVTLEDETGAANLILYPKVYDRFRTAARHSGLLQADGYVERQGKVVHVLAKRLHDLSGLLLDQPYKSRDFH